MTTAAERALRLYPRAPGLRGVYVRGAEAARRKVPKQKCPYPIEHANTWRRAHRLAWLRGWYSVAGVAESEEGGDIE